MRKICLLLVCLAFSGNGRRMQAVSSQSQRSHDVVSLDEPATPNLQASASGILHPMKALGTLLLGFNLITGFKLSGRGVQSASIATTAGLHPAVSNRQGQRAPATGMNAGNEAKLLQRYLQLKAILPDTTPLSNSEVELLISQAEKAANPVEFDEERIWGEWQLVWQLNTKKATKSQKALAPLPQYSNFQLDESGTKVFRNIVQMTKNRFKIIADVKYDLDAEHSPANRLVSTISGANLEVKLGRRFGWKPLRIPLPLKGKGWLDVTYLSDDMRITRGNRGSLFVHLRPRLLSRGAAKELELNATAVSEGPKSQ